MKAPKVYVRDTGLPHALLTIESLHGLRGHPKVGASWEGFVVEQVLALASPPDAYFWGTHGGAELDLLFTRDGRRLGFECKHSDAPTASKSMHVALADLSLERLFVVHPGEHSYRIRDRIEALSILDLTRALK